MYDRVPESTTIAGDMNEMEKKYNLYINNKYNKR